MPNTITSEEFSRWMTEQGNFRSRLEGRLADQQAAVMGSLGRIEAHLSELNGRTRKNSEAIAATNVRLDTIEKEADDIEKTARSIRDQGCSQYAAHVQILQEASQETSIPHAWTARKRVAVGGGLVATGTLLWPALTEIAKLVHAYLDHMNGVVP
jgi:hypothetical protein